MNEEETATGQMFDIDPTLASWFTRIYLLEMFGEAASKIGTEDIQTQSICRFID